MKVFDCAVIGAGPAGVAAAVQLKRYGLDVVLLEKSRVGGLILNANLVENYVGFPSGIAGKDYADILQSHIDFHEINLVYEEVQSFSYDEGFTLSTSGLSILSKSIIVATGTVPLRDESCKIDDLALEKIHYNSYSLDEVKDSVISVIGAGDAAFDYAIRLSKCNRVNILNRSKRTKCLSLLEQRVSKIENIQYICDFKVIEIRRSQNELLLISGKGDIYSDYAVYAIGRQPSASLVGGNITRSAQKFIEYAGDVQNGIYRQASIAAGDGVKSAMKIYSLLTGIN